MNLYGSVYLLYCIDFRHQPRWNHRLPLRRGKSSSPRPQRMAVYLCKMMMIIWFKNRFNSDDYGDNKISNLSSSFFKSQKFLAKLNNNKKIKKCFFFLNQMGNFVPLPVPTTTTIPPPTTLKPSAPRAIDNLVPRIAEGPSVSFILFLLLLHISCILFYFLFEIIWTYTPK